MRNRHENKKWRVVVPPWLIIGAALVLIPIFILMARESITRHQEQTIRLLTEKGAAIIRSLEAGVRAGVGMRREGFHLQKLLMETAEQSDIDYIIIADTSGVIIADSDPLRIGTIYETSLELGKIAGSKKLSWHRVKNSEGYETFEVYRGFTPLRGHPPEFIHPFYFHLLPPEKRPPPPSGLVVFAGLSMAPLVEAYEREIRRTAWNAFLFLLLGLAGFVSLMFAQGYREARSSLSRVTAFSDSLVENMPIGLIATDPGGILTACNRAAEQIFAINEGTGPGKRVADVIPPECGVLFQTSELNRGPTAREIICPLPGGDKTTLDVVSAPLYEKDGAFLGVIAIFRDMTEIKRLEEEVARSRRLASLGGLAAGVAHEIRNPLSSIKGLATHFHEKFADAPDDRKAAEVMIGEVDRMNRVVTQLIEFARPLKMTIVPVSLSMIIRHALTLIEKEAAKQGVAIKTEFPDENWEIPVDADRMTQVFLNLFINAIHAMENGGELRVSLLRQENGTLRVAVSDTGVGIAAADIPRVFDPYFTTRPSGTGLGLAICHKIVEAHRGEIFLESEQGKGTTAVVILPSDDEKSEEK